MKLSIVIPVYQAEATLRRCLDSIVGQSFRDWQMVLVDDASTDGSPHLCDDYARRDHRIQVVHLKRNGGLSHARNTGIDKARADYLTFADADDYLAPDTLKKLMEQLAVHPDYDILEYPVYERFGHPSRHLLQFAPREYTSMTDYWLSAQAYRHTYAWNKIYRRSLFRDVRFPEGKTFEDAFTLPKLLRQCRLVATTGVGLYYYCFRADSITQQAGARQLSDLLEANLSTLHRLYPRQGKPTFPKRLDRDFADFYAAVLNIQISVFDLSGKLYAGNGRPPAFPILPYRQTPKLKLLHLLGLHTLCRIHKIFHRNR